MSFSTSKVLSDSTSLHINSPPYSSMKESDLSKFEITSPIVNENKHVSFDKDEENENIKRTPKRLTSHRSKSLRDLSHAATEPVVRNFGRRSIVLQKVLTQFMESHLVAYSDKFTEIAKTKLDQQEETPTTLDHSTDVVSTLSSDHILQIISNMASSSRSSTFKSFSCRVEIELKYALECIDLMRDTRNLLTQLTNESITASSACSSDEEFSQTKVLKDQLLELNESLEKILNESPSISETKETTTLSTPLHPEQTISEAPSVVYSSPQTVPQWQPDEDSDSCMVCQEKFWVMMRRHHCRACGQLVCYECSPFKKQLPWYPQPERVCLPCARSGTWRK